MNINFERGITLVGLCTYVIVLLIVLGILTSITNFYQKNIGVLDNNTSYVVEFEKFNTYFISDVKKNTTCTISNEGKTIVFGDNTKYEYKDNEEAIYRNNKKIVSHIIAFYMQNEVFTSDGVNKTKIKTKIYIGNQKAISYKTNIDYILKYW